MPPNPTQIFNPLSLFFRPLWTVPSTSITIGITVTFIVNSFVFYISEKVQVIANLLAFFYFHSVVHWNSKIHSMASSFFFLLINTKSGLLKISENFMNFFFYDGFCLVFSVW